jgi:hypothetical protein
MRIHKRKEERHIHQICDSQGDEYTSPQDICRVFIQHFQRKYGPIDVKSDDIRVCKDQIPTPQETTNNDSLQQPVTVEELRMAVLKGGKHKATRSDGISSEIFKQHFDIIQDDLLGVVNDMFLNLKVTNAKKIGTIVCIPKHSNPMTPDDFRPITLLNTDYKI